MEGKKIKDVRKGDGVGSVPLNTTFMGEKMRTEEIANTKGIFWLK